MFQTQNQRLQAGRNKYNVAPEKMTSIYSLHGEIDCVCNGKHSSAQQTKE